MMRQQTGSKGREKNKGENLVQKKLIKRVYFTRVSESKNMANLAVLLKLLVRDI